MTVEAAFQRAMARLHPEQAGRPLAVAVSGGGDSMALALLADGWLRRRGGELVGLTVDHGLRPEAKAEAAWVAERLAEHGIPHRTLTWRPDRGASPAAARAARYRLLDDACADLGIDRLLLAHTRDDQAETVAMRRARGSGPGLAGMSARRALPGCTVLRPLLRVDRSALRDYLARRRMPWLDDPSNEDPVFERVRWRRRLALDPALRRRLLALADVTARRRIADEAAADRLIASAVSLSLAGEALIGNGFMQDRAAPVALGALIAAVRGAPVYRPATERLAAAVAALASGARGLTLGGCHIATTAAGWRLTREAGRIAATAIVRPGQRLRWDERFRVVAPAAGELRPLGPTQSRLDRRGVSARAAAALPGLWRGDRLIALPVVSGLASRAHSGDALAGEMVLEIAFDPSLPLAPAAFHIV
ncbi:MAG: tRNA lysidine(34) synthetase TilS [Azospirillaceae bacterium]